MTTQSPKPYGHVLNGHFVEDDSEKFGVHWQPVYSEATVRELEARIEALEAILASTLVESLKPNELSIDAPSPATTKD